MDSTLIATASDTSSVLDIVHISGTVSVQDTIRYLDVGVYTEHPAFLISIVSICIALAAIIIPPAVSTWSRYREKIKLREYVLHTCGTLISAHTQKIDLLNGLIEQINDLDGRGFRYGRSLGYTALNLISIPHETTFRLFVRNNRSLRSKDQEHYKAMFDAIAFFSNHDEYGQKNFAQFFSDVRRHETEFHDNLNAILRLFDRLKSDAQRNGIGPSKDPFLKEYDKAVHAWSKTEDHDNITVARDTLVMPLKTVCKQHFTDPRAVVLLETLLGCTGALFQAKAVREVYSNVYTELVDTLKKKRSDLENALEHFQKKKA